VTLPAALHRRPRPGVRWHRHDLQPVDRVALNGLWLTAPPLTALETALALPDGSTFLDRALQRHVRFPTLYRAYCRHLGRRSWARSRKLICASADRADSAAERLLVRILRDGGVTGWVLGHPFGPWKIDLAFPERKVASRSTAGPGTSTPTGSARTGASRTRWSGPGGTRCGSPGTTSTDTPPRCSPRSATPSPQQHDHRERCASRTVAALAPPSRIMDTAHVTDAGPAVIPRRRLRPGPAAGGPRYRSVPRSPAVHRACGGLRASRRCGVDMPARAPVADPQKEPPG
jgi:hypothetical protein